MPREVSEVGAVGGVTVRGRGVLEIGGCLVLAGLGDVDG